MAALDWRSSTPWLSRILGLSGPDAPVDRARDIRRTRPELPGNSYRQPETPSLHLNAPPFSQETHLAVDPSAYLRLRRLEWKEYEQQEHVFVVVTAAGRLYVYVDRACAPVMDAVSAHGLEPEITEEVHGRA